MGVPLCIPSPNNLALPKSQRSYRQKDMIRSTPLVILIKNVYTLWGRKRFLLPVTYYPTNQVYPFTLRVTGKTRENRYSYNLILFFPNWNDIPFTVEGSPRSDEADQGCVPNWKSAVIVW